MAGRKDFDDAEWVTLRKGIVGTGMLVSLSDRDFTDTFGEVSSMAKYLAGQEVAAPTQLIRELAHDRSRPFGLTDAPDKILNETMSALRESVARLESKSPDDVGPYKAMVLGVAEAVAAAKGGGVSAVESEMVGRVRDALG